MSELQKVIKTQIKHRIDNAANWAAQSVPPLKGEFIIYEAEGDIPAKLKIGDGVTTASNLPFITDVDINNLSAGVRIPESETNSVGSETQPVYWHNGRPYSTTYKLEPISNDTINEICGMNIMLASEVRL